MKTFITSLMLAFMDDLDLSAKRQPFAPASPGLLSLLAPIGAVVLDKVLPLRCAACGAEVISGDVCPACYGDLTFLAAPCCQCCGEPFPYDTGLKGICGACAQRLPPYDRARAAVIYGDVSRKMVLGLKHGDRTELVSLFARWMARAGGELLSDADIIVPVPLHWTRLLRRRFNQSAEIARRLGRQTGTPVLVDGLMRRRRTASQGFKNRRQRLKNVAGAFSVRPGIKERLKGQRVLLIDDVLTTGATVEACTKALKRAGAGPVDVLTLARVVTTH